ncbi:MAG: DUF192 domain-containing protein [Opitutaceae bacterium]|nr:DUF192 domain-containing protein [Opitutaceae bacterium]
MPSLRLVSLPLALLLLALLAACGGGDAPEAGPKSAEDYFPLRLGDRQIRVQVAALPPELQRGLMFRSSLGADDGMLFVFTAPQQLGFFMRNTTVPLDIGYFDAEGVLREIYPMHPLDERAVRSRGRNLKFALEMNQGWFGRAGVKPGARLDLPAVADALRARGLEPAAAGLR